MTARKLPRRRIRVRAGVMERARAEWAQPAADPRIATEPPRVYRLLDWGSWYVAHGGSIVNFADEASARLYADSLA